MNVFAPTLYLNQPTAIYERIFTRRETFALCGRFADDHNVMTRHACIKL